MIIDRIGYRGRGNTCIVLGAGATRVAEFGERGEGALPPLDADFFVQAQRLSRDKPRTLVNRLVRDAVQTFGKNFQLTMEGFLTQIEYMTAVLNDFKLRGHPPYNPYPEMRQNLLQVLAALLHESIGSNLKEHRCSYHQRIIEALTQRDTIISFNYDCLIDYMVKEHGSNKWNPTNGYGIPAYVGTAEFWRPTNPCPPDDTVLLLKMHGSLNWFPVPPGRTKPRLQLRQRWWHQNGLLRFEIAPPEWNKPLRSPVYNAVWRKARERLRECRGLVFIGYSLPQTDLPALALLRGDSERAENLRLLAIVNPDRAARWRIRDVLQKRITAATRILVFDSLKLFSAFIDRNWRAPVGDEEG